MALIAINSVAQYGVFSEDDVTSSELPLNAWSDALNVRFRNNTIERVRGWKAVFGTLLGAPYWALPATSNSGSQLWLYMGLEKAFATDGFSHAEVTRTAGDYTAVAAASFTGGHLGEIPFVNNGSDVPQYWSPVNLATPLQNLTNWDTTWRCGALRAYKQYLVALDVTKGATRYPFMVKWSHPADPGSVPSSWDAADPTKDAGEYNLSETDDYAIDLVPLRDEAIIYKEQTTWGMQWIGGVSVFRFYKKFNTFGTPAPNCAVEFFRGQHLVFTGDDVIVHDGQQYRSIVEGRVRDRLRADINPGAVKTSFVAVNAEQREVWICYPRVDAYMPNKALVWNWAGDTFSWRTLPSCRYIAVGPVGELETSDTWDGDTASWDSDTTTWDETARTPTATSLLAACPDDAKLRFLEHTEAEDGSDFRAYVERVGLGVPFKANAPPDLSSQKFVTELWPRISGAAGSVVKVYLGYQRKLGSPVTWLGPYNYVIGTTEKVNAIFTGRLLAVRFEATGQFTWELSGLEWNIKMGGSY